MNIDVDKARWNNLSSSKQKSFLQDIADDIIREYSRANITGTVYDDSNSNKLLTFETNSRGTITTETTNSNTNLSSLARDLRATFNGNKGVSVTEVTLDGDSSEVVANIYVNRFEWNKLGSTEKSDFTRAFLNDFKREYTTKTVFGYVRDADDKSVRLDTF